MSSVVQTALGTAAAGTVSFAFGAPTTPENTVTVLIGALAVTDNPLVTGVTLGGSADNFAEIGTQGGPTDHAAVRVWQDPGCAGGQTAVEVITDGGQGTAQVFAWAIESTPLTGAPDQQSAGANGGQGTWDSGTAPETTQDDEIAFGVMSGNGLTGPSTLAGPASPWVNLAAQHAPGSSGHIPGGIAGYQVLSAPAAVSYAGTAAPDATADILVITVPAAAAPPSGGAGLLIAAGMP